MIALRKTTGTIQGDVRLNGFEQEKISFRRCSGYVEQFDVQSPQLTVRETVLFSARLRLNSEDPNLASDEIKQTVHGSGSRNVRIDFACRCYGGNRRRRRTKVRNADYPKFCLDRNLCSL